MLNSKHADLDFERIGVRGGSGAAGERRGDYREEERSRPLSWLRPGAMIVRHSRRR